MASAGLSHKPGDGKINTDPKSMVLPPEKITELLTTELGES